ncbi:glycosyltransferase family 2 protein [Frisingicoccus sp.]|uniref:glycosyltransferase family 2 protein n=1 Tax=Frisingicoccus sp. TaxID=1918627 RepID=UPI003AB49BC1
MEGANLPFVSVVIPVRNEHKYIRACLDSVLCQDYPRDRHEVLLAVGPSEDDTEEIIREYEERYEHIHMLLNLKGTISCGLNIGIKAAKGEYIVRMDAHSEFAENYISKCVEYLLKTGVENVGGPMVARGKIPFQKAVALAYHSPFALGGGKQHIKGYEGYSDTVFLGAFRKSTAEKVGLFDEKLILNEDDDFNFRISEIGGKIFITSEIRSIYYPRDTYMGLIKQYFGYGLWKVAVIKKHRRPARLSHLVPMMFVLFLMFGGLLSCFNKGIRKYYAGVLGLYTALDAGASFKLEVEDNPDSLMLRLRLMLIHFLLHVSYGCGFIVGILQFRHYPEGAQKVCRRGQSVDKPV